MAYIYLTNPEYSSPPPFEYIEAFRFERIDASSEKVGRDLCPTLEQHRHSFPAKLLERWSDEYLAETAISQILDPPYCSYDAYANLHPSFKVYWDSLRTHEAFFVKNIYITRRKSSDKRVQQVKGRHAVIRYRLRCQFCNMVGNQCTVYDDKVPCYDPFIEARDEKLGFKFPGVVAFLLQDNKRIMRNEWCWETLGTLKEVVAVYSKADLLPERDCVHGLLGILRKKLIENRRLSRRRKSLSHLTFIEDLDNQIDVDKHET